jgi:hypothetical protein
MNNERATDDVCNLAGQTDRQNNCLWLTFRQSAHYQ